MILKALYDRGLKENYDLAFIETPTPFSIDIDKKGRLLRPQFLGERRTDSKGKKLGGYVFKEFLVPYFGEKKTSGVKPRYIMDCWQYIFGLQKKEKGVKLDWARKCYEAYRDRLKEIIKRTGSNAARALLKCIETVNANPSLILDMMKTNEENSVRVVHYSGVESDFPNYWMKSQCILPFVDGKPIFEYPELEADWRKVFKDKYESKKKIVEDYITGELCEPIEFHAPVNIRGGHTAGALLVSFNIEAFESFNRKGNENAPIGKMSSLVFSRSLIELLKSRKNQYIFPSGATALFWALEDSKMEDIYQDILEADPEAVKSIFEAPYKGTLPEEESVDFCSIILNGESSRISVRDIMMKSHQEVLACLRDYYEDIEAGLFSKPLSIRMILKAAFRDLREGASTEPLLYKAATEGGLFPRSILQALINRISPKKYFRSTIHIAASYGKAFINRCIEKGKINNRSKLGVTMQENGSTPYRLGRLLALFERLKSLAFPNSPNLAESSLKLFLSRPMVAPPLSTARSP